MVLHHDVYREIIQAALSDGTSPTLLALICATSHDIVQQSLYSRLHFSSRPQLALFIETYRTKYKVPLAPLCIRLNIPSGEESLFVFTDLYVLFSTCFSGLAGAERDDAGRLTLDSFSLRMYSHAFDTRLNMIHASLSLISPRRFSWTGPDPPQHFAIAIVPPAIPSLFSALSTYTNLVELELTHLSVPEAQVASFLPVVRSLKRVHLGQIVFLNPLIIASFILSPAVEHLETIILVDAYKESIWGPRLRRSDVEEAVEALVQTSGYSSSPTEVEISKGLIRSVLRCEAKTERIIGGDRVDLGHASLI